MEPGPDLGSLQGRNVTLPGGRDKDGRPILLVTLPPDSPALDVVPVLQYLASIFSNETRLGGFTVILDARKGPWKVARSCIRQVTSSFSSQELNRLIVLRPDAFWDKQRVENCTNTQNDAQVMYIPRNRLGKFVDQHQLPLELGGCFVYNHDRWIENRLKIEEFHKESAEILKELDRLYDLMLKNKKLGANEVDHAYNVSLDMMESVKMLAHNALVEGRELIQKLEFDNRTRKFASESEAMTTPQDMMDSIHKIEDVLNKIRDQNNAMEQAWKEMEKSFVDTKDLSVLGEGVAKVTNWILGIAENLLNSKQKVGYDVSSAEQLRREHEELELQCWETYGTYAELLYKINSVCKSEEPTEQLKDLIFQKDFMDFVCRSFASRLERRRNVLITSLRFFRLVSEYFDRTSEVFESLVMGNRVEDFAMAGKQLRALQENQANLDAVERELVKEGEKLSDMLSIPVKDALGREIEVDYIEDIINIRDILDATTARKNIFSDSVELQKLTLEQVTHIYEYEKDVVQAVRWLDELFQVLLQHHGHVGCTVYEIQAQKDDHQAFQETAKGTYNYGCQLLNASLALRQSCKLPIEEHENLVGQLENAWQKLLAVSQEQMTRLRVSAVFHRSVEEQCNQLRDLREAVATIPLMDINRKRARVKHYFAMREKLLVEVGRMVRLGRLLRGRLKEPLIVGDEMSNPSQPGDPSDDASNNAIAIEAITERLTEVTGLAEDLDQALRSAQQDCSIPTTSGTSTSVSVPILITPAITTKRVVVDTSSTSTGGSPNPRPPKPDDMKSDEEFLTASDGTLQHSRSSSYNTASECEHRYSPWWEFDKNNAKENIAKEKMVLAVGLPELPPADAVLKSSPEVPPGKIVREVTETTHLKVQHSYNMGVSSFVLTSETVKEKDGAGPSRTEEVVRVKGEEKGKEEQGATDDELIRRMKECGDWLQLKILEMTPEITALGNTLEEALELQRAHDDVLRQLQNKQSPVEELLRQADQLIATQKPRAEVYAAMAETLGRAWKDVNLHLELRKQILDLNVTYHTRAREFFEKMAELEAACSDGLVPVETEAVKTFLTNLHELRRAMLESLMGAMQAGNSLLGKLREVGAEGTLDSRPDRIRSAVNRAISQVQGWMDELHVKRQVLEVTFVRRKAQLEQCLALAILASDLKDVEDVLSQRRELLLSNYQLGDSSSSAELLKHEHKKLLPEAQQLQERALKITKATEQLVASGCFAGEEATQQAYTILSATSDYLDDVQNREALLNRVIEFFRSAQAALTKLDQIEVQLTTTELKPTSPQLATLHAQCAKAIEEITSAPLTEGYALLNLVGHGKAGTEGVKRAVEELENKKIQLEARCIAHKEENMRINRALNNFFEKQEEIYSWLVSIAEAFLQGHQDMGSDLVMAKDFLDLHNQLLSDLQTKGNEINALLLTLPPILEYLEDTHREEVDRKVEELHNRWMKLKNILENRLDLGAVYVKFHMEADIVGKELDNLETSLQKTPDEITEEDVKKLEEKWESIVPLYQSAKNTGLTFISQANQASEPYLDTKRACVCVESVLERLAGRQLVVTRNWQSFQKEVVEKREVLLLLEQTMVESTKTIGWVTKLDSQLYPLITTDSINPKDISSHLQTKLETVLPDIKRAQIEVEQRIKAAESLINKSQAKDEKTLNVKNKLFELNQKLSEVTTDYQLLLQMMISYFNNLTELDKTTDNFNVQFTKAGLPSDVATVESLIREHEASKQAVLEMFRFTQNECEQIISRINKQEPPQAAEQDVQKLQHILEIRRTTWEEQWKTRRDALEAHRQLCQFDSDLDHINETFDDLSKQLAAVKSQYGESLSASKATSLAFVYFEKTIELLEQRIQSFISIGEQLLEERHVNSPHIEHHVKQLKERWNDFKKQVEDTRKMIDLSIQYFQLVDEAEEWFKEGGRLLLTIARKSTTVKRPEEAQELLNDVENFLKPGEAKQDERINKIMELAEKLYGQDRSQQVSQVVTENREMLHSFTVISNELNTLARNLELAEEQKARLQKEQEEANANLAAAKAEAEAAHAAAVAAEEAKRAAEAAAKALREAVVQKVEVPPVAQQPTVEELEAPVFTSPLSDAIIQEGSKFTFICRVTGKPMPVVTWYKDSISIQNNPDYQTTFDQGLCTLTIEETFAEDSAKYTCKAINAAGTAETQAVLSVKETEPEEQLIPPSFVKLLEPASAKEGLSFQFECKVEGNPLPTVQWFKNSECIDNSPDYSITYNNGEAILKFEKIFLHDKAEYTCKASNEVGTAQSTANLSVIPSEPAEAPTFTTPLSNVMARAGQKIKLECEVAGIPPPILTWSHNGKPIKETRELKLYTEGNKATLIVHEAFPKDAGTYVVTATNLAGEATSASSVSVKGRLPTETSDSEMASDMEPVKPSIQVPLTDITSLEGNRIRLDCVIVGQPEPEVIWYHNDRPVKESPDFQLLFQGDRCSLIIHEALPEDAGEYKVVALNSAGEASSKCVLTVTPVITKEESPKPAEEKVEAVGSPPKFDKLLSDVLVSEGDKVIFEANVTGVPRPEIKWFLNNQAVNADDHIKISHSDDGTLKLEIEQVKPEDKGVYTVKASNPSGDAKCFAQLIVKTQKIQEAKQYEEVKAAPVFKESFKDQTVFENNAIKFECVVIGKPTPKARWLFNDKPVSGKDFLVSTAGDRQILAIPEATKATEGTITCVAENEAGKTVCTARLTVQPVSTALLPEINKELTRHTESSYILQREVVVQTATSSAKVTSDSGTEPEVEVHKKVTQDEKTVKQIDQQAPSVTESHKLEEYHKIGAQPPTITEKTVTSVSSGQVEDTVKSIQSIEEKIVQKPVVKTRPPKFVTPVIGKIVDQGVDVVLEGILDALPSPEIKWLKNGVEIKPSDDVKISWGLNKARLELKNVNSDTAGRYTCQAVNEAGTAVSTSDLVVRKTIFPPVFGRRLQAQVIKKGDRVNMEVEITGTPEPTVTWYKDNIPINQALTDGYKIKSVGNSYSLVIEKADLKHSGRYTVKATNAGGEAQSIADMAVYEPTPDTMVEVVKTVVFEDVRKHETLSSSAEKTSESVMKSTTPVKIEVPKPVPAPVQPLVESFSKSESQFSKSVSSKTEISSFSEKKVFEDSQKSIKSEQIVETPTFISKTVQQETVTTGTPLVTKIDQQIMAAPETSVKTEEIRSETEATDSGIQTSSISKQSSLQYFVKKIQEGGEDITVVKETVKAEPIKPELYKKFEDISKTAPPPLPPKPIQPAFVEQYKKFEEFQLTPEPPPEICYVPKTDSVKTKEEVSEKVKLLEVQKELAPHEVPRGGVKILPTPKPEERSFSQKSETFSSTKEEKSFMEKTMSSSYSSYSSERTVGSQPKPSVQAVQMEKLWTAPKPPEIERPASVTSYSASEKHVYARPHSAQSETIEKSMTGREMEKSWAHKFSESHFEKSWSGSQREETKTPSYSVHSTLEKKWTPYETKSESMYKESTSVQEQPVPHYIANVSHTAKISDQAFSKSEEYSSSRMEKEHVIEERSAKPSEIIKSWPPVSKVETYKPFVPSVPPVESLPVRPVSVQDITDEVYLEPGPPPEIGYAEPPRERRQSYVETIEQDLEKTLEREPAKLLPCAVRTMPPPKDRVAPPPLPPKKEYQQPPPLPARPVKYELPKRPATVASTPFERFPELEPFPFRAEPERPRPLRVAPPPTPSKFVKGRFTDSDYESDIDFVKIPPTWRPSGSTSDTEGPVYRRVQPPRLSATARSRSTEKEPLAPSQFERPPQFQGPPRPQISFEDSKALMREASQVKTQAKHFTKTREVKREIPPPVELKPGSPPVFVQADRKVKPESPKAKHKTVIDGYMADTDEPFIQQQKKMTKHEYRSEESSSSEYRHTYQSSGSLMETSQQRIVAPKLHPPHKVYQHKKHTTKELISTPIVTNVTSESLIQRESKETKLEPFPFKAEPTRPKRAKVPPPPSPSKFVKGEFRESDYESDYEGRIPPVWRAADSDGEPAYRPVRPNLTPSGRVSQTSGRTPTPPTEFDHPPQIVGPPRPKFEPIEKFKPAVKTAPVQKQVVFKPKPVTAKPETPIADVIVATPAVPEKVIVLEPGTPPEIGFAPGPQKTQYYQSTTSAPYQNAVQTETSNIMHFNEATENCRRTVSLQQTTKVIKFGDQYKKEERKSGPPPTKPKRFVPGEFRESDYESEVEGTRIRPKWAPSGSDTEEPQYRRVRAPAMIRSSSVPSSQERVVTPMEFDTQPPQFTSDITTRHSAYDKTSSYQDSQSKFVSRSRSVESPHIKPYTSQITKSSATKIASQHMDSMTQAFKSKTKKFVDDIMEDVNKKSSQKPILKSTDEGDAQVYREESRAAQYGTKHVDPDTGLIYFKYDFGYEFGIILPGESKRGEIPVPKKTIIEPPKRTADIEMPVYHETTKPSQNLAPSTFKPKKIVPPAKNVKWEPTSESEMSEYEGEARRRQPGWEQSSCSPASLSPSLPSTSPAFNSNYGTGTGKVVTFDTPPSCPSTPGTTHIHQINGQAKRPPLFITPLRDIAVVSGQTARFECIVQSEQQPSVLWSKNGRIIENSKDYQLHYRNGVCRLTIPQAYPEDAGTYTCTATNSAGATGTTATLQVPGERRSSYI